MTKIDTKPVVGDSDLNEIILKEEMPIKCTCPGHPEEDSCEECIFKRVPVELSMTIGQKNQRRFLTNELLKQLLQDGPITGEWISGCKLRQTIIKTKETEGAMSYVLEPYIGHE